MSLSNRLGIGRLKIPTKLLILVSVIGIVAVALAGVLLSRQSADIAALEAERQGLSYLRQVHGAFQHVQQHRNAASLAFATPDDDGLDASPIADSPDASAADTSSATDDGSGDGSSDGSDGPSGGDATSPASAPGTAAQSQELERLRGVVAADFEALASTDENLGAAVGTQDRFAAIHRNWNNISSRFDRFDAQQSFDAHTRLLEDLINLALTVGEGSGLRTTSDLASFYLADTVMARLLEVSEDLSQLQARGVAVAQAGLADAEAAREMRNLEANVQVGLEAIERSLELAFVQGFGLRQAGEVTWQAAENRSSVFIAFTDQELLRPSAAAQPLEVTPAQVAQNGNEASNALNAVSSVELNSLAQRLDTRLDRLRLQLNLTAGAVLIGLLLSGLLAFLVATGLTRQLSAITDTLGQIGIGNFAARTQVVNEDELGTVARSLNSMLDNTLALIQSHEERDSQQTSIMKLLDEVSGVAEGDLSRDAEVTPEITGAIADAFNFMLDQLRGLVGDIQGTATQVGDAAEQFQVTTESLAVNSDTQSRSITDASETVAKMAISMQQVSSDAAQAADVASRSLDSAQRGAEAVTKTAVGMNKVRQEVQETSKRIKRLGESSQEIGEIAKLINEIADRTGMLALNASIQAASAGEAGRGFAVVAAEVERLAVRAADSTKRIDELIRTIQGETGEVIIAMEETTREVVQGSSLATEAGATLAEIETVSNDLAGLVGGIADASTRQASTSETVARSMKDISEVSLETSAGSRQAAASVQELAALVGRLRDSVRLFKLPDEAA